ncbi:MAG TPA: undecaprenyl-phosphate glucose phosphotransferase [Cyclobacteriaceae bacterium]|nr:undecaprenyl-phosphate glucose phosphotransferase [Cyclobacteriaceae bacterium]
MNLAGLLISLNLFYLLAYYLTFNNLDTLTNSYYFELLMFFNISLILSVFLIQPHDTTRITSYETVVRRLVNTLGLYLLFIFALIGIRGDDYSRKMVFVSYLLTSAGISMFHLAFFLFLKFYRRIGYNYRRVIIIGYGELAMELRRFFKNHPEHGYKFLGYFDDEFEGQQISGKINDAVNFSIKNHVDEIYCCLPHLENENVLKIVAFGENNFIKVKLIPDYRGFPYKGVEVRLYDYIPVLEVRPQPLDDMYNRLIKRSFDVIFSFLVVTLLLSWLLPIISLLIKLDSKGPVFFRQIRHGKGNQQFICYKFRTMYSDNGEDTKQAIKNDPRVTRIGKILRKTSLDEVPQFFNVLHGEMSVIGPRPHPIQLNAEFSALIEKFMMRHSVKPGITGLAQARGYRGETSSLNDMRNRVKLDRFYAENWSMLFDFRIMLMTLVLIFRGDEKAY